MKTKVWFGGLGAVVALGISAGASAGPLADEVNPFFGTGGIGFGVGALNPGPYLPHGMVKLGPDTTLHGVHPGWAHCGGYWYPDPEIRAFTHTHPSGIGVADYGNIGVMPTLGFTDRTTREEGYRSAYSHASEEASAGYYAVTLDDTGIRVELTAGDRAGLHRYTFPAAETATLVFDPTIGVQDSETVAAEIDWDPATRTVSGFQHYKGGMSGRFGGMIIYFYGEVDRDTPLYGTWVDGVVGAGETHAEGQDVGLLLGFPSQEGDQVQLRLGLSYISVEQARANLRADMPRWDFEAARAVAEARWEDTLGVIEVEGGTERERTIFYSSLYRTTGMPTDFTEVGEVYLGFDRQVHPAQGYHFYSDLSLWDTYRTLHPLYNLIYPTTQRDVLQSLTRMYEQSGDMPKWPMAQGDTGSMVGEPADIVLADAWIKGIQDFDLDAAWPGLGVRHGWDTTVDALGFTPVESGGGSVSKHLEYAFNDFSYAVLARDLGMEQEAETRLYRALSWSGNFNPGSGFLQPRHEDGSWVEPFAPHWFSEAYTEGNAWQLLWFVPHDMEGLISALGGPRRFTAKLARFFERSAGQPNQPLPDLNYWHGNEPDIQASWLFYYVGRPDLGARWVRWVMENKYTDGPDGLDGNDDGGTLSAWYVFSALGLFPVPAQDFYLVGTPVFERSVVHLAEGDLVIEAPGASPENLYVVGATLDGAPLRGPWVRHDDIAGGAVLRLELAPQPSEWGTQPSTWPPQSGDWR